MQDSAKKISVAIQNYLRWNENEESGNTQQFSNQDIFEDGVYDQES
jgi:hypothetical protein